MPGFLPQRLSLLDAGPVGKRVSESMAPGDSNAQQGLSPANSRNYRSEVLSTLALALSLLQTWGPRGAESTGA